MAKVRANNASGGGGLQAYVNTVTLAGSGTANLDFGFVPKHIAITSDYTSNSSFKGLAIWDEANGTRFLNTNSSSTLNWRTLPGEGGILLNISGTTLSFSSPLSTTCKFHVFAIG